MTVKIAVAGKGGSGKTTFTALLIKNLKGRILAVDADPNYNLHDALGVKVDQTIGCEREKILEKIPPGMTKQQYMQMMIEESLVETDNFDLLVMGRPEGKGCYCYANTLIREYVDMLYKNYDYVIIDNEAGMEHLSRRTNHDIDHLFMIAEPSLKGIRAVVNISKMIADLTLNVKNSYVIVTRTNEISEEMEKELKENGLTLTGNIPMDQQIYDADSKGKPLLMLQDSIADIAVGKIIQRVIKSGLKEGE